VVDDTVTYRKIISDLLADLPGVEVVGVAANGQIALKKLEHLKPDLLTLDLEMPEVDGLEVLRRLKAVADPPGAIMLSALTEVGAKTTMEALELGAFDFVTKPAESTLEQNVRVLRANLVPKIEAYSRVVAIHRHTRSARPVTDSSAKPVVEKVVCDPAAVAHRSPETNIQPEVVAIGISTGGPKALMSMMPALPGDLATPLLIVQHMPPIFTHSLAESLNCNCALDVREARDGDRPEGGCVLIAPGGKQMKVVRQSGRLVVQVSDDPPENNCRPSADYLFRSVAHTCGPKAVALVMTGMGSDGTLGCRLMKRRGARILAQDEASCVVFGMPKLLVEEGIADVVSPLQDIAGEIIRCAGRSAILCK
jgi:two-component system chemotaxis response regulator CheB